MYPKSEIGDEWKVHKQRRELYIRRSLHSVMTHKPFFSHYSIGAQPRFHSLQLLLSMQSTTIQEERGIHVGSNKQQENEYNRK